MGDIPFKQMLSYTVQLRKNKYFTVLLFTVYVRQRLRDEGIPNRIKNIKFVPIFEKKKEQLEKTPASFMCKG